MLLADHGGALEAACGVVGRNRTETVAGGWTSCPPATIVASRRVAYGPMRSSPSALSTTTYQCIHMMLSISGRLARGTQCISVTRWPIPRRHKCYGSTVTARASSRGPPRQPVLLDRRVHLGLGPVRLVPLEPHRAGVRGSHTLTTSERVSTVVFAPPDQQSAVAHPHAVTGHVRVAPIMIGSSSGRWHASM